MVLAQDKWSQWAKQIPAFLVLIVREKWKEKNTSTALYKWNNRGNCINMLTVFTSARHTISEIIFSFLSKCEPQIITLMKQTFLTWQI